MFNRLHVYTVHRQPGNFLPEEAKFVKEGFNVAAFAFTFLWALYQRLWLPALALFALMAGIAWLQQHSSFHPASVIALQLGVQILIGYGANDWLRGKLKRKGYITADIVTGDSKIRAEQRYFERALAPAL